jgi:hypothetical protein
MFRCVLRLVLLGLAAGVVGLMVGWMVPAERPTSPSAPIDTVSVQTFHTEPLSVPSVAPPATSDVTETTIEQSGSAGAARKRKQLKTKLVFRH